MKDSKKQKNKNEFMLHFAYGSNMLRCRLEERVGTVIDHGIGKLEKYEIKFNKKSRDDSGKANIVKDSNSEALGVVYELSKDQLKELDGHEKGYKRSSIDVIWKGETKPMEIYIALPERINNSASPPKPTKDYLGFLICGAKEHGFPEDYIESLRRVETK